MELAATAADATGVGGSVGEAARGPVTRIVPDRGERSFLWKEGDEVAQGVSLDRHLLGGGGELLGGGRSPLRDRVDLTHCAVNLLHTGRLLVGTGGHLLDELGSLANRRQQLGQQRSRAR